MRDFMEFYDGTLQAPCDFLFFLDADTFILDGSWASCYFEAFDDPRVAAVSFIPRRGAPAIFALLCRTGSFRALPPPALACRYEFPENWPHGVNLQPGEFAARELAKAGMTVVNIGAKESSQHTANFRGTTGIRSSREHITRAAGEDVFLRSVAEYTPYLIAAYDNVLLGCMYEALHDEPFAPDPAGTALGGSLTVAEMRQVLKQIGDIKQLDTLRERFRQSRRNILRLAAAAGVELSIPFVAPNGEDRH
jgi:hypothetical protein